MIQYHKQENIYRRLPKAVTFDSWKILHIATGNSEWSLPPHIRTRYCLMLLNRGTLSFRVGLHTGTLEENRILCVRPGMRFTVSSDAFQKCDLYIAEFDCSDFDFFSLDGGFRILYASAEIASSFYRLELSFHTESTPDFINDASLLLILRQIADSGEVNTEKQRLTDGVRHYIHEHICDGIDVQSVSDAFGYHRDYLGRVVRKTLGMTLGELITAEKLSMAKNLLSGTDYAVAKIAEQLRFGSANSFHKFFHYHTGITPAEYRMRHSG